MLNRYLGNKQSIMTPLLDVVAQHAQPGDHVADMFSGSLSVSLGLKQAGYRVTSNDVNLFSSVLAEAYLLPEQGPRPLVEALIPEQSRRDDLLRAADAKIETLRQIDGFAFLGRGDWIGDYRGFVALLEHLSRVEYSQLPGEYRRTDFYDAYSEAGQFSAFVSARGSTGRRRFFTPENARRIDLILNQVRAWRSDELLDPHSYNLILAVLLRAVERVSNTQGTYHDFPRDKWDSRALHELRLDPPALDSSLGGVGDHRAGREQDSLTFMADVAPHKVLYLDPPYNFRQYSAYYFMPNVISRYAEIQDLDDYFGKLKFVRGQNPDDDFTSTFCKPSQFVGDMAKLISRARCDTVMISYFTGRNHWTAFDSGPNDTGRDMLTGLLSGAGFVPGSVEVHEISRRNYASYGGFTARTIDELIFTAKVRHDDDHDTGGSLSNRVLTVG